MRSVLASAACALLLLGLTACGGEEAPRIDGLYVMEQEDGGFTSVVLADGRFSLFTGADSARVSDGRFELKNDRLLLLEDAVGEARTYIFTWGDGQIACCPGDNDTQGLPEDSVFSRIIALDEDMHTLTLAEGWDQERLHSVLDEPDTTDGGTETYQLPGGKRMVIFTFDAQGQLEQAELLQR